MQRLVLRIAFVFVLGLAALALAFGVAGARYVPDLRIPKGLPGSSMQVRGVPLRVMQGGQGRDVLFIHGSSGLLEDFRYVSDALGPKFHQTFYDRPGHGLSGDSGDYSLAYNAEMARALIEQLGLKRVIVVGHSYGGSSALALALAGAPQVSAYVVLDSPTYKPLRKVSPLYPVLALPSIGLGVARALPQSLVRSKIAQGVTAEFRGAPPPKGFVALRTELWANPKVTHALAWEHTHVGAELAAQSPHYPELRAPLYIIAQKDDPARAEAAQRLQRDVQGSALELWSGTGHYIQVEKAGGVAQVIRRASMEH